MVGGAALIRVGAEAKSAVRGAVSKRSHDDRGRVSSVRLPDV